MDELRWRGTCSLSVVNFKRSPQKLNLSTSPTKQTGTPRPGAALHAANQGWLSDLEGFQAGLVKLYAIYFMKKSTTEKSLSNTHAESKIKKKKSWGHYLFRICFKRAQAALIYFWENIWLTIVNDEFRCCALDQRFKVGEHLILYIAAIWTKLFFLMYTILQI